tara:strand:- start:2791 stop:2922 length:132 start_codon:yes stop_codon:yes gene_type:complete
MSILSKEMLDLHESVIAAAQIIEDLTTKNLWDDPKYKAKPKVT